MIKLDCNNYLIKKTLINYLENKNIYLASGNVDHFTTIVVKETKKSLFIIVNDYKKEIPIPIDLNFLLSEINKSIFDINIPLSGYNYYPYHKEYVHRQIMYLQM